MASPLDVAPPASSRRSAAPGRALLAAVAVLGVLFTTVPAQAAPPATAAQAAELVAARGHQLEVITEEFNEARETLTAQRSAAEAAAAQLAQATAVLGAAQQQVRGIARAAYTGEGTGSFRALMTSDSADEFVGRIGTLQSIAGHQSGILEEAAVANVAAAQAQATAAQAAVEAQTQFDAVAAQQAALQAEIAGYQAAFDSLSADEQRVAAAGHEARVSRGERQPVAPMGAVAAGTASAQTIVDTAMAQRGKPYVWAASGPGSFDCSGLTSYAYAAAGIDLPHSSRMQAQMGQAVTRSELQPGDLVAFYSPVSHIGIYIGNGQMVHAPTSGDVVKVSNIDTMGSITAMRRIAG